jgi:hypothetical protein
MIVRKDPDPDPYLILTDPGGIRIQEAQNTYGSFGSCSGSAKLAKGTDYWIFQVRAAPVMREIVVPEGWGPG